MSSPKRKRLSADDRRELIERAARDLFAERGYRGASTTEIARRAGVTPPVLYDHFPSKAALQIRLLQRTSDELLQMWVRELAAEAPTVRARVEQAFGAWARYVEGNRYAPRMFFRETTGDPEVAAAHAEIASHGQLALAEILRRLPGGDRLPPARAQMITEMLRGGLTELAIWWQDHPEVDHEEIVAAAMATYWDGLARLIDPE